MKHRLKFELFQVDTYNRESGKNLPPQLFSEISTRWPQFRPTGIYSFVLEADEDDPVVPLVISYLRESGREPYFKRVPSLVHVEALWPTHFQVEGVRVFESGDYAKATLFWMTFEDWVSSRAGIAETGVLSIPAEKITGKAIGALGNRGFDGCLDRMKQEMEKENFVGLKFLPTEIVGARKPKEPIWQIASDRTMPPLLNRLVELPDREFSTSPLPRMVPDDDYYPWLLRFSKSAVERLGEFDIAHLPHGLSVSIAPEPFVSRRFREWCLARKLKINFHPVALE
jgi:hypothetical protein